MTRIADVSVTIQTSAQSVPAPPPWFGEVALLVYHLRKQGALDAMSEQVRFARRRFGHFEILDFVAVLFGYAICGERTLATFYERLQPWASAFMTLFGRDRLPSRSALSPWLAALDQEAIETLRTRFLSDLLARRLNTEESQAGLWDRAGVVLQKIATNVMDVRRLFWLHLGRHSKQASDEYGLTGDLSSPHSLHLPLPDPVHHRVALERAPGRLKREEAEPWLDESLDEAMILLHHVVELLDLPQFARGWHGTDGL